MNGLAAAGATSVADGSQRTAMTAGKRLQIDYSDPNFEATLLEAGAVTVLNLGVLPRAIKLSNGMDKKGFYFVFERTGGDGKRYYYPCGLKEIKVNGQSIDTELERKWLLEAYLAQYRCSFKSLDGACDARSVLSYFCALAQMPNEALESAIEIM